MVTILRSIDKQVTTLSVDELLQLNPKQLAEQENIWIDLVNPTREEELLIMQQWFKAHELVLADCRRAKATEPHYTLHHPKVEEFEEYLFIIIHALHLKQHQHSNIIAIDNHQINLLVAQNILITHHYDVVPVIEQLMSICMKNPHTLYRGPDYTVHLILDAVVDNFLPFMVAIEDHVEQLERMVFSNPTSKLLAKILDIKRTMRTARRSIIYQREIVNRLARGEFALISTDESMYYRNVYDHLVRMADSMEASRDAIVAIMDVYFSVSSERLNQVMKVLTVFSTIFLPITFISSLYGMNFEFMPELHVPWAYPAVLSVMFAVVVSMIYYFKRRGWIG